MKKIITVVLPLLFIVVLTQNAGGVTVHLLVWQIQMPFFFAMLCCALRLVTRFATIFTKTFNGQPITWKPF